ncbi:MAG: dTDP-4-dehydrorhamnose reductase [Campylobacterota bacterium]|nr:dTDP-4-dehydrorhamnose reductase [Campylobacterota bacterium]
MFNVLVTGANGQLGSEIKHLMDNSFFKMDPLVKPEDDKVCYSSEGGNPAMHHNYHFHFATRNDLDLSNLCKMEDFFEGKKFDVIINCVAYTAVDRAEDEVELADTINHKAVEVLASIAKTNHIKLIHISTDYVFDGTNYKPYIEDDITNPQSVYGKTKLDGENAMLAVNPPNSIIIRTSWVYSSFGSNFVKTMLRLGKEKANLGVIFDQVGTPTYAKDLAKTILDIIPQIQNEKVEIYNYSNEGVISWYDFAKEIMKMAKLNCQINPIETKEYPTPAKRPHYSVLNKAKIKNTFNVEIPYWKDGLDDCLKRLGERK